MKKDFYLLFLLTAWVFSSCSSTDETPDPDPTPPPLVLSEEIDIYEEDLIDDGIVLAIENAGQTSYLVDKTGKKLFTWNFDRKLGNDLELLPDGRVLGIFKPDNPSIIYGGYGGIIRIISPDGSIDWEYNYSSEDYIAHHDVNMLPNGNVLFLVWEKITAAEAQAAGVNADFDIFPEKLIEVDPDTDQIVWEWRAWDHIIQDFDNTKPNFGDIANNPQLIDINYTLVANGDIMHANGIDYDPIKDVVHISVNFYHEVWVVDHSTTTGEAASSTGGNYNKGGDLIYRFGNPLAYKNNMGTKLFDRNHYPNIIDKGKPGAGNMLIYVNGVGINQSTALELDLPDTFSLLPNTNNEPAVVWSFTDATMYSDKISGVIRLSNGNTMICEGDFGYWEITPTGEIAWKYNGGGTNFWRGYVFDLDASALPNLGVSF